MVLPWRQREDRLHPTLIAVRTCREVLTEKFERPRAERRRAAVDETLAHSFLESIVIGRLRKDLVEFDALSLGEHHGQRAPRPRRLRYPLREYAPSLDCPGQWNDA